MIHDVHAIVFASVLQALHDQGFIEYNDELESQPGTFDLLTKVRNSRRRQPSARILRHIRSKLEAFGYESTPHQKTGFHSTNVLQGLPSQHGRTDSEDPCLHDDDAPGLHAKMQVVTEHRRCVTDPAVGKSLQEVGDGDAHGVLDTMRPQGHMRLHDGNVTCF